MALRELFAKFVFDFDQSTIDRVTNASKAAEGKVAQLASRFTGASAAATAARAPLAAFEAATAADANVGIRLAGVLNTLQTKARSVGESLRGAFSGGGAPKATQQLNQVAAAEAKVSHGAHGMGGAFKDALAAFGIFGGVFGAVFAGGAIKHAIVEELEEADALAKMSAQLGIGTEALQSMGTAAKLGGIGVETFRTGIQTMTRNLGLFAALGKGRVKDILKDMGVGIRDIKGEKPEDLFWTFGKAIASIEDPVKKSAFAQRIFGESGVRMLSLFKGTAEEIEKQKALAEELGVVYSEEFAHHAEEANDQLELMHIQFKRIKVGLIANILPGITWATAKLLHFAHRIAQVNERTNAFKAAFLTGGWALFSKVLARLVGGGGGVVSWLKRLWPLLGRVARFLAPWILWTLVLDDVITFLQGGDSALGRLLDRIGGAGSAKATLEDIKNTAAAIGTALLDAWNAARDWATGNSDSVQAVKDAFGGLWSIVQGIFLYWKMLVGDTSQETQDKFLAVTQPIEDAFTALGEFFHFLWTDIKSGAIAAVDAVVDAVKNLPVRLGSKVWQFITGETDADFRNRVGAAPEVIPAGPQPGDANYPSVVKRGQYRMDLAEVPPMLARPPERGGAATLNDHRSVTVNVSAHDKPAAVGHAVAAAVNKAQPAGPNLKAIHAAVAGAPHG